MSTHHNLSTNSFHIDSFNRNKFSFSSFLMFVWVMMVMMMLLLHHFPLFRVRICKYHLSYMRFVNELNAIITRSRNHVIRFFIIITVRDSNDYHYCVWDQTFIFTTSNTSNLSMDTIFFTSLVKRNTEDAYRSKKKNGCSLCRSRDLCEPIRLRASFS